MGIVVESTPGHEDRKLRAELRHIEAGHEGCKIEGMGANVGDAAACAGSRGVGAPLRLLVPAALDLLGKPILHMLNLHDTNRAKIAI